ncbi:LysR family transcriptional regulator [Bowmanella yangjiangensis]|uniref:LysR family transcriptional regulator n=1 Tax=Bowmanella yangjiangensis TaxID=2811230 RepID=A0ABS3CT48_9ALTE|nr:LysR family transcriptional regulator [Bowmanella yangjiangensis]MBN7820297.1 LysR family transcriptional regulator [Bowmanella yangjiangensis]
MSELHAQSPLSLKSLEAFRAIIQTGSATAAANALGVTQPAISRLLAAFEEHVGFALFYREKSRLFPTDEALALFKEVELTLQGAERISLLARNIFNSDLGWLKIVAPNSFIAGPLADVVADFLRQHPRVNISLDTHSPASAREMVAHRSADCGFIQLPENHPGLRVEPMLRSHTMCALSPAHPLATRSYIEVQDLQGENLILLGKGRYSRLQIDDIFRQAKVPMKVKLETHTVAIACTFAKRNLGVAIVNDMLARQYADSNLLLIPFKPTLIYEYGFITSAHAPMSRLSQAFFEHCQRAFSDMQADYLATL